MGDDKLQPSGDLPRPAEPAAALASPDVNPAAMQNCIAPAATRWLQLGAGIVAMMAVTNFQYAWTQFVVPLEQRYGWSRETIQVAFSIFLFAQTLLVPAEAYLALRRNVDPMGDRFSPRLLLVTAGFLVALAWVMNATTGSLAVLYVAQALSGSGSGIVYSVSMGNALKWFPDRRGLAAGLTAAAFGAGSAATVLPIRWTIADAGYEAAFLWFGLVQGICVAGAGLLMRFPEVRSVAMVGSVRLRKTQRDYTPREVLRTPAFWLLYVMMTAGAIPGLLMTGQKAPMAADFGIADVPVTLLGITAAALPFALMLDPILGGLTRPAFGWFSDRIGRELALFAAFALEGTALCLLIQFANSASMFVVMSGVAFFGWGAIFSLFPAASGDLFGQKYATTNYALLYTAKAVASLMLLLANRLQAETASWEPVFVAMIAADWIAALLALFALRPLRKKWAAAENKRLMVETTE
jgi:OFA family oxalate/formate antiporter-like MFS transporter